MVSSGSAKVWGITSKIPNPLFSKQRKYGYQFPVLRPHSKRNLPMPDNIKLDAGLANVIDELCSCGHLKSVHGDTVDIGHGTCVISGCDCFKFTFIDWVLVHESENVSRYKPTIGRVEI